MSGAGMEILPCEACNEELEEGRSGLCDDCLAKVTGATRFSSYCRWESGGAAECANVLGSWLEELERVGATIDRTECGGHSSEVSYTMTLRQAFEIDWDWSSFPADYLAEHVADTLGWTGDVYAPLQWAIDRLFKTWSIEQELAAEMQEEADRARAAGRA